MDELVALIDAAGEQDSRLARISRERLAKKGTTAAKVAELLAEGKSTTEIAAQLGRNKSTIGWHIRRLGVEGTRDYIGRRAIIATLGGAGLRASELCDVLMAEVRLHDPAGARLRIPDSKTDAGVREVQASPDLVEELVAHIDRLRRAGLPTHPGAYLFPNRRGGRMARQRVSRIVNQAARLASERLVAKGLPPLPVTTPHSLRRTYVSIALLANNFDVMWVMSQVGHADSKMTTDVYNQLQQRARACTARPSMRSFELPASVSTEPIPTTRRPHQARSIRTRLRTRKRKKKTLEDVVDEWRDEEAGS